MTWILFFIIYNPWTGTPPIRTEIARFSTQAQCEAQGKDMYSPRSAWVCGEKK